MGCCCEVSDERAGFESRRVKLTDDSQRQRPFWAQTKRTARAIVLCSELTFTLCRTQLNNAALCAVAQRETMNSHGMHFVFTHLDCVARVEEVHVLVTSTWPFFWFPKACKNEPVDWGNCQRVCHVSLNVEVRIFRPTSWPSSRQCRIDEEGSKQRLCHLGTSTGFWLRDSVKPRAEFPSSPSERRRPRVSVKLWT